MTLRKAFVAIPAGAVIAAAAIAPVASSAHAVHKRSHKHHSRVRSSALTGGSTNCNGTAPPEAYNLIVPTGKTCTMNGTHVYNNVAVNSGATLIDNSGRIDNNLDGNSPKGIGIGGTSSARGTVGGYINITGTSGSGPGAGGTNYICDTTVATNLTVTSSTSKAGKWVIGDNDEGCGTNGFNQVGMNMTVESNGNHVDVADNIAGSSSFFVGIGKNLTVTSNAFAPVVEHNFVAGSATCQSGTTEDADGSPNIVNGMDNGCH